MAESYILLPTHGIGQLTPKLISEIRKAGVPYRFLLLEDSNVPRCGVPYARNRLMKEALKDPDCTYIVHLSSDIDSLQEGWLAKAIDTIEYLSSLNKVSAPVGAVSLNKLVDYGQGFGNFRSGRFVLETEPEWNFVGDNHVQVVTSLCVVTREAIEKVGFFDENYGLGGYEEIDMALRMWVAGFRVILEGDNPYHHRDTNRFQYPGLNEPYFAVKWGGSHIDDLTAKARAGTLKPNLEGKIW